ncbi:MAG: Lrp/AsnC family transcriptional regulator [Rhodospirillaceae bacterium]|nr:Lrp/AsnC family transcriptional regulator [Rhodospirillaceae bacterium]
MSYVLDDLDRRIITATQAGLPLCAEPYKAVAEEVGCTADEVMARMTTMLEAGAIRRIGVVPNHYKLGYTANGMTVWNVADEDIQAAGREIGNFEFVSHCYHRPRHLPYWPYNLFAMVHGRTAGEVDEKVALIAKALGARARGHQVLLSTKILKKTGLRLAA